MVDGEELADGGVHAGGAPAGGVGLGAGAAHLPHVGGGPAQVGDGAAEGRVLRQGLDLPDHARVAARGDVAPLVLGDAAEGASGGAAAQDGHAPADLLQGRDVGAAVARVRGAREGELVHGVELLGGGRRHGLVHHHVPLGGPAPVPLHHHPGVLVVVLEVVELREMGEGPLVLGHLLEGGEHERLPGTILEAGDRQVGDRDGRAGHVDEAADVLARGEPAGDLDDGLLPLAVDEEVGAAVDEHRGTHPVLPVVVVGDAPQRGLDPADHDGCGRPERPARQPGVDRHGPIGAPSRLPTRRVGVVRSGALVGGVVVDERVHRTGGDPDEQAGAPQAQEVLGRVPARLGHDSHPESACLQDPADHRCPEGGVIDVGVAGDQEDVDAVPAAGRDLGGMHGQEPGRRIHATYMGPRGPRIKRRWFLTDCSRSV